MFSELEDRSLSLIILEPAILIVMTATCIIGNVVTCIAAYRNERLRTSSNLYVIALAISDAINASTVMPLTIGVLITGRWPYGEALCNVHAFFTLFSVYVSPTTMGLTAFNRYVRIVRPGHYSRIFNARQSKIYVAAIWLTVSGYALVPRLAGWTDYGFIPGYAVCTIVHPREAMKIAHYCIVVVFFFLLPLAVATFSYYKIFTMVNKHKINTNLAIKEECRISVREIHISKSLAIIVLAFALCWICLLYTSPSPRDGLLSRMPSSA